MRLVHSVSHGKIRIRTSEWTTNEDRKSTRARVSLSHRSRRENEDLTIGIALKRGEKKSEMAKSSAAVSAHNPVRPPSKMPVKEVRDQTFQSLFAHKPSIYPMIPRGNETASCRRAMVPGNALWAFP